MPTLAENKKALFDYKALETLEAGLKLTGPEVKSAKTGRLVIKDSYAIIDGNLRAWLLNSYIAPYPPAANHQQNYSPDRTRELLLHKSEIKAWLGQVSRQGLTILPLSVYTKGSFIKVKLILGQGKRKIDKRQTIKKRELDREINRTLKSRQ
ncbi:MAG: SsrA-binding protein SmpB [Candidatus Buchananbacteria bacterium]